MEQLRADDHLRTLTMHRIMAQAERVRIVIVFPCNEARGNREPLHARAPIRDANRSVLGAESAMLAEARSCT